MQGKQAACCERENYRSFLWGTKGRYVVHLKADGFAKSR